MKQVIFLDFDGPLFPNRVIKWSLQNGYNAEGTKFLRDYAELCGDTFGASCLSYTKMDDVAVGMLRKLNNLVDFEVVVSSSWNRLFSLDTIKKLFELNGLSDLKFHEHWYTPRVSIGGRRTAEIEEWLEDHPEVVNYVIVDDVHSGSCLKTYKSPARVVWADPDTGLSEANYTQIYNILK
jgi:hypothetical protein